MRILSEQANKQRFGSLRQIRWHIVARRGHVGKGYIGSQKSSLLCRQACNIIGLIRRKSDDTVESAEIYKSDHPKLFDSMERTSLCSMR